MKRYIITATLLWAGWNIFAQIKDFNLSDYQLPEIKRQSLDVNFNLAGNNNVYRTEEYKNSSENYDARISLMFRQFFNTVNLQREISTYFSMPTSLEKEDNNVRNYKRSRFKGILQNSTINRMYLNTKVFLETDLNLFIDKSYEKIVTKDTSVDLDETFDMKSTNLNLAVPLKAGLGRIEPVQDARQAVYILDELSKLGKINTEINNDGILRLAQFISKIKNERFFDSRIKKIQELEAIDSFLISNNYIKENDIKYFAAVNDLWDFGDIPVRESGKRIAFALYPTMNYSKLEMNGKNSNKTYSIDGGIEFTYEKPINLYWQNSIAIRGLIGTAFGDFEQDYLPDRNIDVPNTKINFKHSIGYYPNTRTNFKFSYGISYIRCFKNIDLENNKIGGKGSAIESNSYFIANYYFSPQLRLNFQASIYYEWQDVDNSAHISMVDYGIPIMTGPGSNKNYGYYFSASLLYSIF